MPDLGAIIIMCPRFGQTGPDGLRDTGRWHFVVEIASYRMDIKAIKFKWHTKAEHKSFF